jgi:hypothetical protein
MAPIRRMRKIRPERAKAIFFQRERNLMIHPLIPHPETTAGPIESIDVELRRSADGLAIVYWIYGDSDLLALSPPAPERRRDGLWQATCFEAFLRRPCETGYREYNFSPSSEWAAYEFDAYREGRRELAMAEPPIITLTGYEKVLEIAVMLPLDQEEGLSKLGLSAVIEEKDGTLSYWALAHPPGRADFHDPACFALELPAAD